MRNKEIEIKFLEINVEDVKKRLIECGAEDLGDDLISETVFYDKNMDWPKENKFVRIRSTKNGSKLTYKHSDETTIDGTVEIEFGIDNVGKTKSFLEVLGLVDFREQEKKRHSFRFGEVMADIDTWPGIPTYLELEGPSEEALKSASDALGFDWSKRQIGTAGRVIQEVYNVPVKSYKIFTFKKQG